MILYDSNKTKGFWYLNLNLLSKWYWSHTVVAQRSAEKPYLRVYIQLRFRHACHETRDRQSRSIASWQGREVGPGNHYLRVHHTFKFRTRLLTGTTSGMASDCVRGRGQRSAGSGCFIFFWVLCTGPDGTVAKLLANGTGRYWVHVSVPAPTQSGF